MKHHNYHKIGVKVKNQTKVHLLIYDSVYTIIEEFINRLILKETTIKLHNKPI